MPASVLSGTSTSSSSATQTGDQLYAALSTAEQRLGRPVQATIRERAWLEAGSGAFHDTITSRPLVKLAVPED